jgi:ribosome-associated protein
LSPEDIKTLIEKSLDADKATDVNTIDLSGQSPLADYMIIASGTSSRHVGALATKMRERLEARGVKNVRIEGIAQSDWVVLDAGDVIVHLFRPEVRSFYNIEKMWGPYGGFDVVGQQVTA